MIKKIVLRHDRENAWKCYEQPVEVVTAWQVEEVEPLLREIENKVLKNRLHAAGFISYEAASGLDRSLVTRPQGQFPLLSFGLYETPVTVREPFTTEVDSSEKTGSWSLSLDENQYREKVETIKARLASGDTYQVNFTYQQQAEFAGDPWQLFLGFAVDAPFGAFLDLEDYSICCGSPELFFEFHEGRLVSRPMKGTSNRGMTSEEDEKIRNRLSKSGKDRAENIMIVDMIRNDIGKVASTGSVGVTDLFKLEKYPTVWQMTSTVSADSDASVLEILKALFPCASITGAPKANTMKIIKGIESQARNIYTGCIGFITPDGNAQFNVAIRTALVDKKLGTINYGIGGGIVWDSDPGDEFAESLLKGQSIREPRNYNSISLIETLLWTDDEYFLLDYHFRRVKASAGFFDYPIDLDVVREQLAALSETFVEGEFKVRLLINRDGGVTLTSEKIESQQTERDCRVALANRPTNVDNPFIYHKTTRRRVFDQARGEFPDCDDVILWNEAAEITESTIANVVIRRGDKLITPPWRCGLLRGTYRQYLLDRGEIEEGIVSCEELKGCDEIYLINSVRKWRKVQLV